MFMNTIKREDFILSHSVGKEFCHYVKVPLEVMYKTNVHDFFLYFLVLVDVNQIIFFNIGQQGMNTPPSRLIFSLSF